MPEKEEISRLAIKTGRSCSPVGNDKFFIGCGKISLWTDTGKSWVIVRLANEQ